MGHKPNVIYVDGEPGIRNSEIVENVSKNITYIPLKTHTNVDEWMIVTFKTMLHNKLENHTDSIVQWT